MVDSGRKKRLKNFRSNPQSYTICRNLCAHQDNTKVEFKKENVKCRCKVLNWRRAEDSGWVSKQGKVNGRIHKSKERRNRPYPECRAFSFTLTISFEISKSACLLYLTSLILSTFHALHFLTVATCPAHLFTPCTSDSRYSSYVFPSQMNITAFHLSRLILTVDS